MSTSNRADSGRRIQGVETRSVLNTLRVSTPRISDTLTSSTFSTHGSSIAMMSQTLMFQIGDVSIVSLCIAVPDIPNGGV